MAIDLFNTGTSGLLASQQQLATVGHNIANVNTDGYSRQSVEQNQALGNYQGNNLIGSGTYVQDISRVFNSFTYREQLITQNNASYSNKLSDQLDQLDATMSTYGTQISNSLDSFYGSLHSIAEQPDDITLRSMALTQAESITVQLQDLQSNMTTLTKTANNELVQMADRISAISAEIGRLNVEISGMQAGNLSGEPNDLLDQRNRLLNELNDYVKVTTLEDPNNGVMTVMIGEGQTLVAGTTALSMSVVAGDPDPLDVQLQMNSINSSYTLQGDTLGGAVAAVFDFRDNTLKQASADIDLLAMSITDTMNQAQAEGLDLNGLQGADIFADLNTTSAMQSRSLGHSDNTPGTSLAVAITDMTLVTTDEYEVEYDGASYQLTNLTTGTTTALGATGTGPFAIPALGIEISETGGVPAAGDKFLIRPTQNAAEDFKVNLTDPEAIAASSPIQVTADENNVSAGSVTITDITDPVLAQTFAQTNAPITVDVYESAPGVFSYQVTDSTGPLVPPVTGTYPAGGSSGPITIAGAGFEFEITGDLAGLGPNAREQFVISDAFGAGNGNNMLAMAATQNETVVNGGTQTFAQLVASSVSTVGSEASLTENQALTADAMFEQAQSRHQAVSGVNLDEEAANMLKYQQAYQASAQIITVAQTIFDTILSSVR
ncbi:flagellar hook-associated protein FlgK [Thalassomonas actiniarum]|uniref:Flagellar hook-associated protein 1 n=1 Tax=Thalassomonas actiniarum TaxID=485447 RepID=A0AAE9YSL7_9GAMM|nr:flagellar hook-associated protein FlgK [Thalassomonas actiniarum]WDE00476.1 flagellar hook-associated protein FlgK [Thalassomonas actiniarum]